MRLRSSAKLGISGEGFLRNSSPAQIQQLWRHLPRAAFKTVGCKVSATEFWHDEGKPSLPL